MGENKDILLDIKDLSVQFNTDSGVVKAVNHLNMKLERGKSLGFVGETGAGKTTTALSILQLVQTPPGQIVGGEILFNGVDVCKMTETEKEMQTIREAATEKDLRKLDSLTHHLRSSWEVLRADQPLNVLYRLLHSDVIPDEEVLSHAVIAVLNKGAEIIRLAEEERRKYENG